MLGQTDLDARRTKTRDLEQPIADSEASLRAMEAVRQKLIEAKPPYLR